MKKTIALLLCLVMLLTLLPAAAADEMPNANLQINATNFPDANFREWVKTNLAGGKTYMTASQVANVKVIYCYGENINSLEGVGKFVNLEKLDCSDNNLAELDLSANLNLIEVACQINDLKSLNVSKCTKLQVLHCWKNELMSIDVSKNTNLQYLFVPCNKLKKIDISKNTALESLDVESNLLTALDVSKNTLLVDLNANHNQLKTINLSKNTKLTHLFLNYNALTALDVSKNTQLKMLELSANYSIKSLNVTKNPELVRLCCADTVIPELDVSKNTKLATLDVSENSISKLDVSKNKNLAYLYAGGCFLTELDVSMLSNLRELNVSNNFLQNLNVSSNTQLRELDCNNNFIRYINLSGLTNLKELDVSGNRLEFLTVSGLPALEELHCGFNRIRCLHLESNTNLKTSVEECSPQFTVDAVKLTYSGGVYTYNMRNLFETGSEAAYVKPFNSNYSYNASTYVMTMPGNVSEFKYLYDTGKGDMEVEVYRYFDGDFEVKLEDWGGLTFKGTTPYMVWNGTKRCPPFAVYKKGTTQYINPWYYDYRYEENTAPGTGYLYVRMYGNTEEKREWFKIYMPPTTSTSVANTAGGITITWAPVEGAAGYVVYRRAMNLSMTEWSKFDRWNNTTETTFTDTKVYAGTRYQYGVKAYFTQRTDPVSGATIGGAMDNYNLGLVGPLKTTVRIKTNSLSSVTAGTGKLTAKWTKIGVCTGYVVQVATNSSFTAGKKEVKVTDAATLSKTITGLTSGKTYYVRVRGYNVFNGTTYYGEWSNVKNCKVN